MKHRGPALCFWLLGALWLAPRAPAQVRLWTPELPAMENSVPAEQRTLRPVAIVAARNGSFSGKVALESAAPIRNARATLGPLTGPGGALPPAAARVRFAVPFDAGRGSQGPEALLDAPPAETTGGGRGGHVLPIWVTVSVPKSARAGRYAGELTVQAEGLAAARVPVTVDVADFALPDPQDYRTWCDVVQSPDTLALEYDVPLWSPRHWELIARSFQLISGSGSRMLYAPLIVRTNIGNEQSMVRWIQKGEKLEPDYAVFDRYLDTALKNLGAPKLIVFWVWDISMSQRSLQRGLWGDAQGGQRTRELREDLQGKGPRVTRLNPATGATDMIFLPRYSEASGKALWRPVAAELRRRLAARGLEKTLMLGMISDLQPDKEDAEALKDIWGGAPWAAQCHPALFRNKPARDNRIVAGVADLGYLAHVYAISFQVNPALGRRYGWQSPVLDNHYYRGYELLGPAIEVRHHPEFALTGGQRGVGRIPGDFWPVVRDARGRRVGRAMDRYPENLWRNLDILTWFLAPGPDGPVATTRFEHLREGLQECEVRVFLESALLDDRRKARLGPDLARRCQETLDARQLALWRTVWNNESDLLAIGNVDTGRNPEEGLWKALSDRNTSLPAFFNGEARQMRAESQRDGAQWWLQGWLDRNRAYFALAAEAQSRLTP